MQAIASNPSQRRKYQVVCKGSKAIHSSKHSHEEERGVYTIIICDLQSNGHKQELTGELEITLSHAVGHLRLCPITTAL